MSLSSALNTAVAGLTVTSKRAETVADNVANADLPGYARRSVQTASPAVGLPPTMTLIERSVEPRLVLLRRDAEARAEQSSIFQSFHAELDAALGDPDQPGSLQDRLAAFDAAILAASGTPGSDASLAQVAFAASDMVSKMNDMSDLVQEHRQLADARIGEAVTQINADLTEIARLNADILRHSAGGDVAADLFDRRTLLVDRVSTQIPVRVLPRDGGPIALISKGGQLLLDGKPAELSFTPSAPISATMEHPGLLSGLSINGTDLSGHGATSLIAGGGLSALFSLRDEIAPAANDQLDGFAQELISRFSDPAVDPTLAAGAPGLFTDGGGAITLPLVAGLAGRLTLNAAVNPEDSSTHWRFRDGLGAAAPGPVTGPGTLVGLSNAILNRSLPVSTALSQVPGKLPDIASALKSKVSNERVQAEFVADRDLVEVQEKRDLRDGGKVDVDAEMRRLLEIEQAYAANARLIQAVGEMMDRLTEL